MYVSCYVEDSFKLLGKAYFGIADRIYKKIEARPRFIESEPLINLINTNKLITEINLLILKTCNLR
jgi:hypothetical protein